MGTSNNQFRLVLEGYLRGTIGLDEAAAAIHSRPSGTGFNIAAGETDPAKREMMEALMGRVLWLTMKAADPNAVPTQPFGAAEFRAFLSRDESSLNEDEAGGGDAE